MFSELDCRGCWKIPSGRQWPEFLLNLLVWKFFSALESVLCWGSWVSLSSWTTDLKFASSFTASCSSRMIISVMWSSWLFLWHVTWRIIQFSVLNDECKKWFAEYQYRTDSNFYFVVFLLFWVLLLIITEKNERDVWSAALWARRG